MTGLLRRLRLRLRVNPSAREDGWVLLTSIATMSLMVTLSLTLLGIVDTQTGQSRQQRVRETAFNLAEAGLNAQIFSLSRDWPGIGAVLTPYPTCTSGGAASSRCPSAAQIAALIPTPDADGATWQTVVRDNSSAGTARFYSDSTTMTQPAYDSNGDGELWVRSTATAKGKTRTIVALVRAEQQEEDIPHAAIITGRLEISNMGNKYIIDASVGGGTPTAVVRCTPVLLETTACLGHPVGAGSIASVSGLLSFLGKQLSPNVVTTNYTGGSAMTVEARARLKATAVANGTYYTGCPTTLTGAVVYIEAGTCTYNSNTVFNSAAAPGMVLMASGSLYIGGTHIFHGIIYHANELGSTGVVMQVQGNATVIGGVLVDGNAATIAGSSKLNIQLAPDAFRAVRSYGSAGVIQNTWREIRG